MVVLESLSWHCRTTSCLQADRDQGSLTRRLDLVMALLQIDTVRDIWLAAPEWKPAFEGFFTIKVLQAPSCRQPQSSSCSLPARHSLHASDVCGHPLQCWCLLQNAGVTTNLSCFWPVNSCLACWRICAHKGCFCLQAHTAVELAQHVPVIHFPEAERVSMPDSVDKERYKKASKALRATMAALYDRHSALARLLLDAPVAATCEQQPPFSTLRGSHCASSLCP